MHGAPAARCQRRATAYADAIRPLIASPDAESVLVTMEPIAGRAPEMRTTRAPRHLPLALLITTLAIPLFAATARAVQLKAIGRFGFAGAHSMVHSARGNLIAVGTDHGTQVIDAETGRPVVLFRRPFGRVAFSPDARTIASAGSILTDWIGLWDIESGLETGRLEGGGRSLAFSPDGRLVAGVASEFDENGDWVSRQGGDITLWSLATRGKIAVLGSDRNVQSLAFSPDGATVATGGGGDDLIRLWDIASRREMATLTGHTDTVLIVAFSPDGSTLASGSRDGATKLWDVGGGQEIATLTGHTAEVGAVAFSADGETLATGSYDHTVRLWDVASARETAVLTGHESWILMVAFSPDGDSLVSGSSLNGLGDADPTETAIRVWDLRSRRQVDAFGFPVVWVRKLAFSPDGALIATSGSGDLIALWDVASRRRAGTLAGSDTPMYTPAFSPDGTILATRSPGGVTLWDVASWQPEALLAGSWRSIAFSPDGTILATGGSDEFIALWDVGSFQRVATLVGHADVTSTLAFSPDGSMLAGGGYSRTRTPSDAVWLWDVALTVDAARAIGPDVPQVADFARWHGHDDAILDLEFSPDGRLLASGDRDQATRLWDVATRRQVASLDAPDRSRAIAFSPDGRTLVSAGNGGSGTLWDKKAGQKALKVITDLEENAQFGGEMSARDFADLLGALLAQE